jgi:Flp pilus assembly protein TadD
LPDLADALLAHGQALRHLGRSVEALIPLARAHNRAPDRPDISTALAMTLMALGRDAEAVGILHPIARDLDAELHFANALLRLTRSAEALVAYDRVLASAPDHAEALDQRAIALLDLDRFDEALDSTDRALAIQPNLASALGNRARILMALGRQAEAVAWLESALASRPDDVVLNVNLSSARLLLGDFDRGLAQYEWRWRLPGMRPFLPDHGERLWLGEGDLAGQTIILYADQGLGDTIQFARYAALVAAKGASVVLFVQPPLGRLLRYLKGVDRLLIAGDDVPAFDFYCPLLSLPLACGTRLGSIPAPRRYIEADAALVSAWAARLGPKTRPRVAVFWSSTSTDRLLRKRAIPLRRFAKLFRHDIEVFVVQKDIAEADRAILGGYPSVTDLSAHLTDFAETAAAIGTMDLIVTVDASVAHLAGAMGKPVWILLHHDPDWRWLLGRDDSPWYPSARLFRQCAQGDWDAVLDQVGAALARFAADAPAGRSAR